MIAGAKKSCDIAASVKNTHCPFISAIQINSWIKNMDSDHSTLQSQINKNKYRTMKTILQKYYKQYFIRTQPITDYYIS